MWESSYIIHITSIFWWRWKYIYCESIDNWQIHMQKNVNFKYRLAISQDKFWYGLSMPICRYHIWSREMQQFHKNIVFVYFCVGTICQLLVSMKEEDHWSWVEWIWKRKWNEKLNKLEIMVLRHLKKIRFF